MVNVCGWEEGERNSFENEFSKFSTEGAVTTETAVLNDPY